MTDTQTKVSVIISVYNTENYVRKCLDSLVNQTLQEIEIIAINNGSTDNSLLVLQEYEKKYPNKMKVISFDHNTGDPAIPWNTGIKEARGEYFSIVDSDDWCELDAYEIYYRAAKKKNYDLVISNHYEVASEDRIIPIDSIKQDEEISIKEFLLNPHLAPWGKIIKKSFFADNKFEFVSQIHCDTGLNMIMYSKASSVYVLEANLYYYNQMNPNSETNTKKRMRQATIVDTLDHIFNNYNREWEQEVVFSLINFLYWFCFYEYRFHMDIFIPFIQKHAEEIKRNKYIRKNRNNLAQVLPLLKKELPPKKIVYGLIGKNDISDLEKECIDSWKKYTAEYEFIGITENDIELSKHVAVSECIKRGEYKLANTIAVLAYLAGNGGIGLSTQMKMNAPIGELRMNNLCFCKHGDEVQKEFISVTADNYYLQFYLSHIEANMTRYTYDEFSELTNDFVLKVFGKETYKRNYGSTELEIVPINKVGFNIDGYNLFEYVDKEIYDFCKENKSIGRVLSVEESKYIQTEFTKQAEKINMLSNRIQQIENSRTWRYAQKLSRIRLKIKKVIFRR